MRTLSLGLCLCCAFVLAASCDGDGDRIAPEPRAPGKALEAKVAAEPTAEELRARERAAARAARLEAERQRREEEARRLAAEQARLEAERAAFDAAYPLHGVVFHFIAQVFAEPNGARAIGYMRRGSQFRAKNGVRGPGCSATWHEVPGGGFVCRNQGYLLGETPQTFEPSPAPPALDDALPYSYAFTQRDGVIQYWRLPTMAEETAAADMLAALRAREERARALAARQTSSTAAAGRTDGADGGVPSDAGTATGSAEANDDESSDRADAVEAPPPPGQRADVGTADNGANEDVLADYIRMGMLRGFYVSLDREESTDAGRLFYRTVRGAYVRSTDLTPNEPPSSRGVVLGGDWQLPIAIVFRTGARRLSREPQSGALVDRGVIDRHRALRVADDGFVHRDRRYVLSRDGFLVREPAVRIVRKRDRPPGVPAGAKWIHVDLSDQYLVAYEGETPVFATLVSTGKPGFETPTGLYRIQSKHVSTTMDDDTNPEGAYSIEDVPWTMYFHGNFALHGAFWHYTFGRVRSHGCVNLAPADARWLFGWSTPTLPASWHGIFAGPRDGTFVFIEE